jgi:mannose-6-phosphate isomerase-like protein (cupin superfamily)
MKKVNFEEKLKLFSDCCRPRIVGEFNDNYVKVSKHKGEFVWHSHKTEDELFLVIKGRLCIKLRDEDIWLEPGEFVIVPHGIEHNPVAEEETHIVLIEPKSTVNTGDVEGKLTVKKLDWI